MISTAFRLPNNLRILATTLAIIVGLASWRPVEAQESLSSILNLPQLRGDDELPPPKPAGQSAQVPALPQPPQQAEAAKERIYLGLDGEPPLEGIGVRVAAVTKDSPAWKAGFKVDDRILGINGFAIGKLDDMVEQLGKTRPGQSVNFLVNREGRNMELIAVLMNADVADQIQSKAATQASSPAWLGVTAYDLSESFRAQFGVAAFRGAAVSQVVNGSPAYRAGVRPGDAIVEIAGRPVESAADLQRWVESGKPGDQAQMIYFRGASRQTAKVVLSTDPQFSPQPTTPRVQAFPKTPTTNVTSPGIGPTKPGPAVGPVPVPAQVPTGQLPAGQPAESADPNMQLQLGNGDAIQPSPREAALEAEVARLRKELAEAQAKLAETKQQLDNILKALKD